jgi:hypothetical protein
MNLISIFFVFFPKRSLQNESRSINYVEITCPPNELDIITSYPYTMLKIAHILGAKELLNIPQKLAEHLVFSFVWHCKTKAVNMSSSRIIEWFFESYYVETNYIYKQLQDENLFIARKLKKEWAFDLVFSLSGPVVPSSQTIHWILINLLLIISKIKLTAISTQHDEYKMYLSQILQIRRLSLISTEKGDNNLSHIILIVNEYCKLIIEMSDLDKKEFRTEILFFQTLNFYFAGQLRENRNSECDCHTTVSWPDRVYRILKTHQDKNQKIQSAAGDLVKMYLVVFIIPLALIFFHMLFKTYLSARFESSFDS